ncbi:hypothetical protein OsccyDRAFT_1211 [Leptolyngbyaceae cyanobacterium JSC-12]|nr:hypothetical protein OsccyDRAFT_1211 [Leptolyngbyaceae cyanobacterium JSC-12]
MKHSAPLPYDLVLLITELLAILLAVWIIWVTQAPNIA